MSPLTRRILAVNVLALAVLVVGLLYVGQYRQGLIRTEIAALTTQAELFAAALGEAAVGAQGGSDQHLVTESAKQIVRRLAATTRTRAQLISVDGKTITDSSRLTGPGGVVKIEELPPPAPPDSTARTFLGAFDTVFGWLRGKSRRPTESATQRAAVGQLRETKQALAGDPGDDVRFDDGGRLVLAVAVPVQRYKQVLGALVLTNDMRRIDEAVFQVRLDILKVFGVALLVTVLLSVYLAGTIAQPIHRLAVAADRVRRGLSRQYALPDMGNRRDEIGDLASALGDMTEALWKRMDGIERFAADVAHEIKNPLTSLRSAVETVVRLDDPGQQKKLLAIIQDDISRLDRLISDISDASRLDSELSRAELSPVEVSGLLSTLVELHDATHTPGSVRLTFAQSNGTRFDVFGLEDRLVQVFRNLIGNAISFSPEGGEIRLAAERHNGAVRVRVEDDGPGIPDGMEVSIFNRFYQERPASEKFGTHSGLGLSISKQIVEAHGGTLHAENRRDEGGGVLGARFVVSLPGGETDKAP